MIDLIFNKDDTINKKGIAFILAILFIVGFIWWHVEYSTEKTVTFTVSSVDDQSNYKTHKYLVFDTNGNVWEDVDDVFEGKTDSSNLYALFLKHPNGTFTCNVNGFRNTITSSYPNLLSCQYDGH